MNAWARKVIANELSTLVTVLSFQSFEDRDELVCSFDHRECTVILWPFGAEARVALRRLVIPTSLRIHESSIWGPQKYEAWQTGKATQSGDIDFDRGFIVLGRQTGTLASVEDARHISPEVKSVLLAHRSDIWDASLTSDEMTIPLRQSSEKRMPQLKRVKDKLIWQLGNVFWGFERIPSAANLRVLIARAVRVATALEADQSAVA